LFADADVTLLPR